jgi:hypothetical protein
MFMVIHVAHGNKALLNKGVEILSKIKNDPQ